MDYGQHLTIVFFLQRKNYKTLAHRAAQDYHVAVTPSDEAFAWQVLTNYYEVWEHERNEYIQRNSSDYSTNSDDKVKVGPKIGFKKTAGKTVDKYNEYVVLVGKSRKGINAGLWSTTLRQAAQQEKMRIDKEKKQNEAKENSDENTLEEVDLEQDYMEYTQINWDDAMHSAEAV